MAQPIRMALIGCGGMGRSHLEHSSELQGLTFVAYADVVETAARSALDEYGGRYATTGVERIFHDDQIDAVLIATHHDTHRPFALCAAEAGKHIFLEKPMALTIDDCLAIEEGVARAGVKLMMGFKFRFAPLVAKVKEIVPAPLVTVGQSLHPAMLGWPLTPDKGGGPVLSNGCHVFDLVYWLNESEPVRICAAGGALMHPEIGIVDNAAVSVQFANGSIASIIAGDSGDARFTSKFFFEVLDGKRTATLHDRCHKATFWGWERESLSAEELSPQAAADPEGVRAEMETFVRCLQQNIDPPAGPRDGTRATAMVLKAFESIRTGKTQELKL
jgi:predicted dehydrogenase